MLALGVDAGERELHLALLERTGRNVRVVVAWSVSVAPGADRAEALRAAVASRCPRPPDATASSIPGDAVCHRILHLPFSDAGRLAAAVPYELESQVPFELDGSLAAFTVLARGPEGAELLAAMARSEQVRAHLEDMRAAGLDPAVVDLGALATAGLVQRARRDALVLELREDGAVALLRDGRLVAFHGLGRPAERAADEARWSTLALFAEATDRGAEGPPPVVVTAGSVDGLPQRLGAPVAPLADSVPPWAAGVRPAELRAVALAARAAGLLPLGLNFRTGELRYHPPAEAARRDLRLTVALAALVAVLAVGSLALRIGLRRAELDALRSEIRSSVTGIVPPSAAGTERIRLRGAVEALERRLGMLGGEAADRGSKLDLLLAITRAVPEGTAFSVADLSADEDGVRIRARTDSYEAVDVLTRALAELPGLGPPEVRDVKTGVDGKVEFRMTLPAAPAGGAR